MKILATLKNIPACKVTVGYYDSLGYEDFETFLVEGYDDLLAKWRAFCRFEGIKPHKVWGVKFK